MNEPIADAFHCVGGAFVRDPITGERIRDPLENPAHPQEPAPADPATDEQEA